MQRFSLLLTQSISLLHATIAVVAFGSLVAMPIAALTAADATSLHMPLTKSASIVPATVAEGAEILVATDRFTKQLSRFDLESRIGRLDATREDFDAMVRSNVVAWEPELLAKVRNATAVVNGWLKTQQLEPPFPKKIHLICTTGKEEGGAAYCRGAAIVLPRPVVEKAKPARLNQLLAHELFHILSANQLDLQRQLYAHIGFHPCAPLSLPPSLWERKLTNPDGPSLNYLIHLEHEGKPVTAVPLLYASVDRYDPKRGGSFFQYLKFQLVVVQPVGGAEDAGPEKQWTVATEGGVPRMIEPKTCDSYFEQIGRNTSYIYHPDEVLADNFVFLLQGKQDLKSPRVVEQMRATIEKWGR